jgi:hypothetical protein
MYKGLAKLYVGATDALGKTKTAFLNKSTEVQASIAQKGGIGAVIKSGFVNSAGGIGKGIDKLVDAHAAHNGDVSQRQKSYATDLPKKVEAGYDGFVKGVSTGVQYVTGVAKNLATRVNAEIATDDDKHVRIGTHEYRIEAATVGECLETRRYLGVISKKIPSNVPGRTEFLSYIASNALHTDAELSSRFKTQIPTIFDAAYAYVQK